MKSPTQAILEAAEKEGPKYDGTTCSSTRTSAFKNGAEWLFTHLCEMAGRERSWSNIRDELTNLDPAHAAAFEMGISCNQAALLKEREELAKLKEENERQLEIAKLLQQQVELSNDRVSTYKRENAELKLRAESYRAKLLDLADACDNYFIACEHNQQNEIEVIDHWDNLKIKAWKARQALKGEGE